MFQAASTDVRPHVRMSDMTVCPYVKNWLCHNEKIMGFIDEQLLLHRYRLNMRILKFLEVDIIMICFMISLCCYYFFFFGGG